MENNKDGAVSIDTPPFLALLNNLAREYWNPETHVPPIIAHADAHAAQRFTDGRASALAELHPQWQAEAERAETAEASLARLVEAAQNAQTYLSAIASKTSKAAEFQTCSHLSDKLRAALLPAKAEAGGAQLSETAQKPEIQPVGKGDHVGAELATPAPATGEELPQCQCFTEEQEMYCIHQRKCMGKAVAYSMQPVEAACMALRQPADDMAQIEVELKQAKENWPPFNSARRAGML